MGAISFQLFNATFIAPYQNLLLLLITLPAWASLRHPTLLGWQDGLIAAAFLALLVTETIADQQQWRFQEDKKARRARGEAVTAEFVTTGLWRFSRHPNFFCEISIWWCVYAFSIAAGAGPLNATILGPILLTLLFQGSTAMTEGVTKKKYPAYADYQRRTSRLIPLPPSP
jgi:steroid 5-alpha reductase family enzyme